MMRKFLMGLARFNQPDGQSAAADGAPAPAAPAAPAAPSDPAASRDAPPAGQPPANADRPPAFRPEGLPDHLFGANDKETVEKLFKAYSGSREAIAKFGEVPKDVAGYVFDAPEAVKPYVPDIDKDPFFGKVKEAALAHGIPVKAFNGFLGAIMSEMVAGDLVADPFNPDTERAALVPDITDPQERAVAADKLIRDNIARIDVWKSQGLPEDAATWLSAQVDRATANKLIMWVAGRNAEQAPALGGRPANGVLSDEQLSKRNADPRNRTDPAFAAETDRLYQLRHGMGPREG